MTDRERFEAWVPPSMHLHQILCAWDAWQAATAAAEADKWAAVRRCAEIVDGIADDDLTAARMRDAIKAEFPEAWK